MTDDLRGDSRLDHQLDASEPFTSPATVERAAALQAMAREAAPPPRSRRRWTVALGCVAGILALGVGGAAAAHAFDWQSPWADDAVAEVTYVLPSGAVCTGIIGNFKGDDDAVKAAEAFMAQANLVESLDIEAELADMAVTSSHTLDDGTVVPAGPGTPYSTEDYAYQSAVFIASSNALYAELEAQGIDPDGLQFEGEQRCPGAILPSWMAQTRGANGE